MSEERRRFDEAYTLTRAIQNCLKMLRVITSKPTMNERARKETLVLYLGLMFPESRHRSKIESLAVGAEVYVGTESVRGFIDTFNGKLVIEFKSDLMNKASSDKAEAELKRYFAGLWTSIGVDSSFCGIATDVLHWKIYRPVPVPGSSTGVYTENKSREELKIIQQERKEEEAKEQKRLSEIQEKVDEYREGLSEKEYQKLREEAIALIESDDEIKKEFVTDILIRAKEGEVIRERLGLKS